MDRNVLVRCFQNTLKICSEGILKNATEKAKQGTKVYEEYFVRHFSENNTIGDINGGSIRFSEINVIKGTTFEIAKRYVGQGKIGVLNFANPHNPGGGVVNGAMAQEECLCRSSNLYPCLLTPAVHKDYYRYNIENTDDFFSDRIVYTDNVTVFKTDDTVPVLMPENEWFNVGVITCAAPYIAQRKYTNKAVLKDLFKKRIKNIFDVAIENNIDILILGAFGCGAFKNPPEIVAAAFHDVIEENIYIKCCLGKIIFAIKSTTGDNAFTPCPNIEAFAQVFSPVLNNAGENKVHSDNYNTDEKS